MNKYGPYSKEVEEVISFVLGGHVLSAPFERDRFDDYDTYIIHELIDMDRFEEPDAEITGDYGWWLCSQLGRFH